MYKMITRGREGGGRRRRGRRKRGSEKEDEENEEVKRRKRNSDDNDDDDDGGGGGEGKRRTLILHKSDVSLGSPINSIRQTNSTGTKERRPLLFCSVGKVRTKSQEEEAIFVHCQITELVHGQGVRVSFGVVLLNFLEIQ